MAYQVPPVLFIIFNRPSTTEVVLEEIRKAKPKKLFIAADGPRKGRPGDNEKCQAARAVASKIDWDCEVKTLFRDENLGCGRGPAGAISWFFDHVEEGIIIEDDVKPAPEFFRFCAEMLERYRDDTRVMEIAGASLPNSIMKNSPYSYFFSDWDNIWGWATWKRAWKHFDYEIKNYPEVTKKGYLLSNYSSIYERYHLEYMLDRSYYENDKITWWDPQWGFARKINSGLVIIPTKNMIVNLGFGADATNTHDGSEFTEMKMELMEFPLKHPEFVIRDRRIEDEIFRKYSTTAVSRLKGKIKQVTPGWILDFVSKTPRRAS